MHIFPANHSKWRLGILWHIYHYINSRGIDYISIDQTTKKIERNRNMSDIKQTVPSACVQCLTCNSKDNIFVTIDPKSTDTSEIKLRIECSCNDTAKDFKDYREFSTESVAITKWNFFNAPLDLDIFTSYHIAKTDLNVLKQCFDQLNLGYREITEEAEIYGENQTITRIIPLGMNLANGIPNDIFIFDANGKLLAYPTDPIINIPHKEIPAGYKGRNNACPNCNHQDIRK